MYASVKSSSNYNEQPPGVQQHLHHQPQQPPPSLPPPSLPPPGVQQQQQNFAPQFMHPPAVEQQQQQYSFQPEQASFQQYPSFPHQPQSQQQQQQQHHGFQQTFVYPNYVHAPPQPLHLLTDGLTHKRSREDGDDGDDPSKRLATAPEVVFRILIPAFLVGKVIGRHGSHIKLLREETGARVRLLDAISGNQVHLNTEERVVLITSKDELVTDQCPAELCLIRLVSLLLEPDGDRTFPVFAGAENQRMQSLIRILITESQAGGVIGKGGAVIKEIREMSGANIRVLPRDHLPICATACETDRLVQISGEFPQLRRALELIAAKLRENPPKEMISTQPTFYFATSTPQSQMPLPQASVAGYSFPPNDSSPAALAAYGTGISQAGMIAGFGGPIAIIPKVKAEMRVPSVLIGGVIGKGGANISQIRSVSGASVKVSDQKEGDLERIIYFTGTSEQISLAQSLVQAFVDAQQIPTATFVQ